MANVRTNNISVPRIARNKRIYAGNTGSTQVRAGGQTTVIDWASVSEDEVIIDRDVTIQGDLTIYNLAGNAGDTVIVNENGTLATVREVINETPSGTIDGVNVTYTLANLPEGLIRLYKNGQKLKLTTDYTITGDTITLVVPLVSNVYEDILLCDYRYITYSPGGTPTPAIPEQIDWTSMTRGVAAQSSNFDLEICRVGKTITISGTFQFINGSGINSVIASINSAVIAEGLTLSRRVYWQDHEISGAETNRGLAVYIDTFDPISSPVLYIKCRQAEDAGLSYMSLTFNCI